ncbi:hypothetical protein B738_21625 [Photorhabdus temperata subsp. temperata M1021]|nr:hypothetical protein B738_21625 [Photorhabdus temperata subsp. temperata M1021]
MGMNPVEMVSAIEGGIGGTLGFFSCGDWSGNYSW